MLKGTYGFDALLCRTTLRVLAASSALAAALALAVVPAFASKDSVPDWVRTAIAQPQKPYSAETSAVVLLDETTLTVGADGKAVEHHRHVVKILRPKGREDAIVDVPYDKDSKILSLHVWSVGPDGHEYAMKDNEIEDVGYPGATVYTATIDRRSRVRPDRDPAASSRTRSSSAMRPTFASPPGSFRTTSRT